MTAYLILILLIIILVAIIVILVTSRSKTEAQIKEELRNEYLKAEKEALMKAIKGEPKNDKKKPVNIADLLNGGVGQ